MLIAGFDGAHLRVFVLFSNIYIIEYPGPWGRPRTCWRDYVAQLAWEHLGVPPDKLEEVSGEREVWTSLLGLLPPLPGSG